MANTRELLKRRKGVQNTKKITRTMELISTAKLKKLSNVMIKSRPYSTELVGLVRELLSSGVSIDLAEERTKVKKVLLLAVGSNRGLCGAYNVKVMEESRRFLREKKEKEIETLFHLIGKRTIGIFKYQKIKADREFRDLDDRTKFPEIRQLAREYMDLFYSGEVDEVYVGHTAFLTRSRQDYTIERLLPIPPEEAKEGSLENSNYIFEPSPEAVLSELASLAVEINLYRMFLEAQTSEQAYRMRAMKNATENAEGMIKGLSQMYNRARQTQITMELLDIIGGAQAL